uniref:Uncharacterized protein n=1 Tax=uncultured prokaryote TaxID=198431 RepID=A0A0H5Q7J6_9ZZZZ|nr:hypothetical protein [uncultured prokaryote]
MMFRVRTIFTGVAGSPYYNSLYFEGGVNPPPSDLVDAVGTFWEAACIKSLTAMVGQVQSEVQQLDVTTGDIVAVFNQPAYDFNGAGGGAGKPPATQGLLRLRTGSYVNGRQVAGRVFVPGLTDGAGGPTWDLTVRNAVEFAGEDLMAYSDTEDAKWSVYSPTHGLTRPITAVSAWNEFAVQRSRRD